MNWDAAGAIGEIVGAVAVIATLVYLARQVRDSSTQLKVASVTDLNTLYNDAFLPIYNSRENMTIWVTGLESPEDLDEVGREIFILFLMRLINPFETAIAQHQKGTLEDAPFQRYVETMRTIMTRRGARLLFDEGRMALSDEVIAHLGRGEADPGSA